MTTTPGRRSGRVLWMSLTGAHGFIVESGDRREHFFHSASVHNFAALRAGVRVTFELDPTPGRSGGSRARSVRLVVD